VFLWLDSDSQIFDAELVFWSDQLFPQPDDESACLRTFGQYLALAESIRSSLPPDACTAGTSPAYPQSFSGLRNRAIVPSPLGPAGSYLQEGAVIW
jgi:hypothetical protein